MYMHVDPTFYFDVDMGGVINVMMWTQTPLHKPSAFKEDTLCIPCDEHEYRT